MESDAEEYKKSTEGDVCNFKHDVWEKDMSGDKIVKDIKYEVMK